MKATNAYAAKRAVFARLADLTVGAGPLQKVQVSYDYSGRDPARDCVYGGGVRFTQFEDGHDGYTAIRKETAVISLYIAVTGMGAGAQVPDRRVEDIADTIADLFAIEPDLGGRITFEEITSGQGDYWPSDESTESRLGLQVTVTSLLT